MIAWRFFDAGRLAAVVIDRGGIWSNDRFAVMLRNGGILYTRATLDEVLRDWWYYNN